MANSGWVRIKAPAGVSIQVGFNSGNIHSGPSALRLQGDTNAFSAWIKDADGDLDTVFYFVNHTGATTNIETKWMASDGTPGANTPSSIPPNQAVQLSAAGASGL